MKFKKMSLIRIPYRIVYSCIFAPFISFILTLDFMPFAICYTKLVMGIILTFLALFSTFFLASHIKNAIANRRKIRKLLENKICFVFDDYDPYIKQAKSDIANVFPGSTIPTFFMIEEPIESLFGEALAKVCKIRYRKKTYYILTTDPHLYNYNDEKIICVLSHEFLHLIDFSSKVSWIKKLFCLWQFVNKEDFTEYLNSICQEKYPYVLSAYSNSYINRALENGISPKDISKLTQSFVDVFF